MNRVRCAIYTRKSSEEGLEQGFNSLHAQREACAAYVMSQASEGWTLIPDEYDDGGISGGTLERPGLQRLLADISEGRIDIVVVYKVDRLTRSLLDFAKLVQAFDAANVSFVSITQSFNTTTSMGRLTLNMLLSFAQFEREVTAERIRDKIAASKAKGMWMGGTPPLGYEPNGRSLAIVEDHAAIVRDIFQCYLALGHVRQVADALDRDHIRSPLRQRRSGAGYGGCRFTRGQIHAMLRNPVYTGRIAHNGKLHPGQHPALIDMATWDAVQAQLDGHAQGTRTARQPNRSLLAGRIVDHNGDALLAVHANKPVPSGAEGSTVRYRYYVSRSLQSGDTSPETGGIRVPAREIEKLVAGTVAALFDDSVELVARSWLDLHPSMLGGLGRKCEEISVQLRSGGAQSPLERLISQVRVLPGRVEIDVDAAGISGMVEVPQAAGAAGVVTLACEAALQRTGVRVKLVQANGAVLDRDDPNASLVKLVLQARRWWAILAQGEVRIKELSAREGVTASWMTRVVRLAFLAPVMVDAVLEGKHAATLDATALVNSDVMSGDWGEQTRRFLPGRAGLLAG
jgi:DNA invertase Pin-like site-specific DNA recombinase